MIASRKTLRFAFALGLPAAAALAAPDSVLARLRAQLDAVPAIDCHEHLASPELAAREGSLPGLWQRYTSQLADIVQRPGEPVRVWWTRVAPEFATIRTTGFYRYLLPAFRDLYAVEFDRLGADEVEPLDARIRANYRDPRWLYAVVTERANIELMIVDRYWARLDFSRAYPFEALALNVTRLLDGYHPSSYLEAVDSPYRFAEEQQLPVNSLADYLAVLDRLFTVAKARGVVCLKSTRAYGRTLRFERVPEERAARIFGQRSTQLSREQRQEFEDFIMWRLVELAAKHDLPFQFHTGHGQLQGSNPLLLLNLIQGNPRTKFILFHGGYPWVGESGAIAMRHWRNVWLDSVWLPTISPTMARRALHEWLDVMPSTHILWGADCGNAEGIYGATVATRAVLAEVLAERVARGDATEEQAALIGRQILRDNALALFPSLRERLWKHRGPLAPAPSGQP